MIPAGGRGSADDVHTARTIGSVDWTSTQSLVRPVDVLLR